MERAVILPRRRFGLPILVLAGLLSIPQGLRGGIVADPIALDFGDVAIAKLGEPAGSVQARFFVEAPMMITNIGTSPVKIDIIWEPTPEFQIRSEKCEVLDPGESCPIVLRYGPRAAGGHGDTLMVRSSDGDELLIPLWGDAVELLFDGSTLEGPPLSFGSVPAGKERLRALGFVNETGGQVFASASVEERDGFIGQVPPPEIIENGGEFSAAIRFQASGDPGPRKSLSVFNLPNPMLPVVKEVKIPLVAVVNGCLDPLGSVDVPSRYIPDRKNKISFCAASRPRKSEAGISRRLIFPAEMGGRKGIAVSRIRYQAATGAIDLGDPATAALGGRNGAEILGIVPLLPARPKMVLGDGPPEIDVAKRMKSRALALSREKAILFDLEGRKEIAEARLASPFDGIYARSRLRQTRAYAIRRAAGGPCLATLGLKRQDGGAILDVTEITVDCGELPEVLGRKASAVRALSAVAVRKEDGTYGEELVAVARYPDPGGTDPAEKKYLLLLGKRGRRLEARLALPPRLEEVTSLAARRKKGPAACLPPRKAPPSIYAALGIREGRIAGYRVSLDPASDSWRWSLERRSKVGHDVQCLLWKGEEVYACGEVTEGLIAAGRKGISILDTTGHVLDSVAINKEKAELHAVSRPAFARKEEKKPIYILESQAGRLKVDAIAPCIGESPDLPEGQPRRPVLLTGDLTWIACKKKEEEEGAWVTLAAHAFDPDGDAIHYSWTAPGIEFDDPASPTPRAFFPLGETPVYLVLRDGPAGSSRTRESLPGMMKVVVLETGACLPCTASSFDVNGDGLLDISDPVSILMYLFQGGPRPPGYRWADGNGDGLVDISDPVYFLAYLFLGGPGPVCPAP